MLVTDRRDPQLNFLARLTTQGGLGTLLLALAWTPDATWPTKTAAGFQLRLFIDCVMFRTTIAGAFLNCFADPWLESGNIPIPIIHTIVPMQIMLILHI